MLTSRLIELKMDLETSINDIKEGLENLKLMRFELDDSLLKIERLTDYEILSENKPKIIKKNAMKYKIAISFVLAMFV